MVRPTVLVLFVLAPFYAGITIEIKSEVVKIVRRPDVELILGSVLASRPRFFLNLRLNRQNSGISPRYSISLDPLTIPRGHFDILNCLYIAMAWFLHSITCREQPQNEFHMRRPSPCFFCLLY